MRPKSSRGFSIYALELPFKIQVLITSRIINPVTNCNTICENKTLLLCGGASAGVSPVRPWLVAAGGSGGAALPTSASRSMSRPLPCQVPTCTCLLVGARRPKPHSVGNTACLKGSSSNTLLHSLTAFCVTGAALCRPPPQVKRPATICWATFLTS